MLVCSSGGHLLQLVALGAAWRGYSRTWVTFDKSDARSLLADEDVVFAYGPTNRNVQQSDSQSLAGRPRGSAHPAESSDHDRSRRRGPVCVDGATARRSRRLRREPDKDQRALIELQADSARRGASVRTMAGAHRGRSRDAVRGQRLHVGLMIFVTVGTNEAPFDRLVRAVASLETTESLDRPTGRVGGVGPELRDC